MQHRPYLAAVLCKPALGRDSRRLRDCTTTEGKAMATVETYRLNLCADCVYTDANGWDEAVTGCELPSPAPLGLLPAGTLIGVDESDHICEGHFSWAACEGCGCRLGGTRYCCEAVER